MNKKSIIISILIVALILGGIIAWTLGQRNNLVITLECKNNKGDCTYLLKDGLGNTFGERTFDFKDIMQCNVETVYKKDVLDRDIVFAYDFYLHFFNNEKVINFKHKDSQKLASICTNILEKKPFSYKFTVKK